MNVPDYLLQQRPNMEVMHFQCLLKNEAMEDIVEVLDDEKVDEFMEYCICILLRWKTVAQWYGFSTSEIDNFESVMRMYNLYSSATRILDGYKW